MELLAKSGIVGLILAGISIITLAVFLERLVVLHLERRRLRQGRGIMENIADMIRTNTGMTGEKLAELISFKVEDKIEHLSSSITFLRLSSTVSPLLGLLGTVIGMIQAFKQVSEMGGAVKPAVLASGRTFTPSSVTMTGSPPANGAPVSSSAGSSTRTRSTPSSAGSSPSTPSRSWASVGDGGWPC